MITTKTLAFSPIGDSGRPNFQSRPPRRDYHEPQYPPISTRSSQSLSALDPNAGPRPGLKKAASVFEKRVEERRSTSRRQTSVREDSSGLHRAPSVRELAALPREVSIWNKDHPSKVREQFKASRSVSFHEQARPHSRRREVRKTNRALDGSRSLPSSPSLARVDSDPFKRLKLKRTKSEESLSSQTSANTQESLNTQDSRTSNRSASSRVSSLLSRVVSADSVNDDRNLQGHEARKEQQLREPITGKDSKSDSASDGGQGQRGFFGKHKGKGAV